MEPEGNPAQQIIARAEPWMPFIGAVAGVIGATAAGASFLAAVVIGGGVGAVGGYGYAAAMRLSRKAGSG